MKKNDILFVLLLIVLICSFFSRLFYPESKIYITSEYGSSDIINFNLPVKNFLSHSLNNLQLPLWNKDIGTGTPLFAESQIGTFYIPNLLTFGFFKTGFAFNFGYVLSFMVAGIGMYVLSRYFGFRPSISFFLAIIFAFNGFFIGHIIHYNMDQAAAYLPLLIYISLLLVNTKKIIFLLLFSFILSQQIFIGHIQITLLILFLIAFVPLFKKNITFRQIIKDELFLFIGIVLSVLLTTVQIFPSVEMSRLSIRGGGFSLAQNLYSSFPLEHLLLMINPFIFGKISDGSYSLLNNYNGSIYWEDLAYFGLIPLLLAIFSLFIKSKINRLQIKKIWILICFLTLLMLGKYSPLYIIYSIPPFSLFRVPARFNLLLVFLLIILAGYYLEYIRTIIIKKTKKEFFWKIIIICVTIFTIIDIFSKWINFNPVYSLDKWLKPPDTVNFLRSQSQGRILNLGYPAKSVGASYYVENGWKNLEPYYYFRNELFPNENLLWNISQYRSYVAVLWTQRSIEMEKLTKLSNPVDNVINIDDSQVKIFGNSNIRYVITTATVKNSNFKQIYKTIPSSSFPSYSIYQNLKSLSRARILYSALYADSLIKYKDYFNSTFFDPSKNVILEKRIGDNYTNGTDRTISNDIKWLVDDNQKIELKVTTDEDGILLLADSYYPGWIAEVDGTKQEILPANLNQRAILLKKGHHNVIFRYAPTSFEIGLVISIIAHVIILSLMAYLMAREIYYKADNNRKPSSHRGNN